MEDVAATELAPSLPPILQPDPHPQLPSTHPMQTRTRELGYRSNMDEKLQEQVSLLNQFARTKKAQQYAAHHPGNFTAAMIQTVAAASAALKKKVVS